jgi:two-component system phosphate regulon sensor histidine kinase PhoR
MDAPDQTGGGARHRDATERTVSNLAHELRTPLTVILGYAELLRARDDEETRREAPARIVEAAEHLLFVVDDLLTVFAIDVGGLTIEATPVDLNEAVTQAVRAFERRSANQRFTATCDGECWVSADGEHLTRIVNNLLLNAAKHSPNGGDIEVKVAKEPGFAEVAVSDQGLGFTKDQLGTVFERLAPIEDPDSRIRSTGLELYKVRRLVELHGGSVAAESEPGKGSTFRFRIPLLAEGDE